MFEPKNTLFEWFGFKYDIFEFSSLQSRYFLSILHIYVVNTSQMFWAEIRYFWEDWGRSSNLSNILGKNQFFWMFWCQNHIIFKCMVYQCYICRIFWLQLPSFSNILNRNSILFESLEVKLDTLWKFENTMFSNVLYTDTRRLRRGALGGALSMTSKFFHTGIYPQRLAAKLLQNFFIHADAIPSKSYESKISSK